MDFSLKNRVFIMKTILAGLKSSIKDLFFKGRIINHKGFTLIELLVVIAIIGLLASVVLVSLNSARAKSRNAKRIAEVRQIMTALELYYNDNSRYPIQSGAVPSMTDGATPLSNFLSAYPTAPTPEDNPSAGGTCTAANNLYSYAATGATPSTYTVIFCLGGTTGGLANGLHTASPSGIK